ncbi:MAG: hypothetical protein ABEI52_03030, partial [Halobacteriaceae archaeon]
MCRIQEIVRCAGQQRMYSMGKHSFERCAQLVAQAEETQAQEEGRTMGSAVDAGWNAENVEKVEKVRTREASGAPARDEWGRDVPVRLDRFTLFFPLTERATPSVKKEFDAAVTRAYATCV